MTFEYKEWVPKGFDNNSRIWIYQSDRAFTNEEAVLVKDELQEFSSQWHSHGNSINSYAHLFFNRFVVLMADEREVVVGGCSMDSAVQFIRQLEDQFKVSLLNRQNLAFIQDGNILTIPLSNLKEQLDNQFVTKDTLYFNNTILTIGDFLKSWIIPLKESWLASRISMKTCDCPEQD